MTDRYNVFIREHQIVRFSIEVETEQDLCAAILEARKQYEQSGTRCSAQAETEITMRKSSRSINWTPTRGRLRNPSTSNP